MQLKRFHGSFYGMDDDFHSDEFKIFSKYDIEIMFLPSIIKRYLENIQKLQSLDHCEYFPLSERIVKNFFLCINPNFNYQNIKYNNTSKLDIISQILSYIGKSGYNYIQSVNNVIFLNQPVLLFYGIEQLANFENAICEIRDFNDVVISENIESNLNYSCQKAS